MIDFTDCKVENWRNFSGRNGAKLGIVYQGERYMLKLTRHMEKDSVYANSSICEYLGCHILANAGFEVQETILGTYWYHGKWYSGVACRDLNRNGYRLQEFSLIQNSCPEAAEYLKYAGGKNILRALLAAIDEQTLYDSDRLKNFFWDMFIGDALIGNFDRHSGNWGLLVKEGGEDTLIAPIYDCGSSLFPQADEATMLKILNDEEEMHKRVFLFPNSSVRLGTEKINYFNYISSGANHDCTDALKRITPRINLDTVNAIIDGTEGLTDVQRLFYKTIIEKRKKLILDASLKYLS